MWEIKTAFVFERSPEGRTFEAPLFDINYGVGDRIQLKVEFPWVFVDLDTEPAKNGPGDIQAGVKWRFLDREEAPIDLLI